MEKKVSGDTMLLAQYTKSSESMESLKSCIEEICSSEYLNSTLNCVKTLKIMFHRPLIKFKRYLWEVLKQNKSRIYKFSSVPFLTLLTSERFVFLVLFTRLVVLTQISHQIQDGFSTT